MYRGPRISLVNFVVDCVGRIEGGELKKINFSCSEHTSASMLLCCRRLRGDSRVTATVIYEFF